MTPILLTARALDPLTDQHPNAAIIIAADVHPVRAKAIQHHYPTLHLKANATAKDIVWELSHVSKGATIQ